MPRKFLEKLKWLDPFTYVDLYVMPIVNPNGSKLVENIVYIIFAFLFAYVLYNFVLAGLLGTSSPLVIVYSNSMEPMLYRGDVVVLAGAGDFAVRSVDVNFPVAGRPLLDYAEIGVEQSQKFGYREAALLINGKEYRFDPNGPVVVYYSQLRGQDIIHRAVLALHAPDGVFLITFGDNNSRIDEDCPRGTSNCISLYPVPVGSVKGVHLFHIPLAGYVKLLLFDDLPRLFSG